MAIHRGDCGAAIVGGTNLILNPYMTIAMTEQGVLAPDGQCKTFDAAADGYTRGEGVVAIMVKKLSDAVRDNDTIRAIVRSSAVNSDGRTSGLSLPNSASHEALMRRTHDIAGLPYSETAMIECHGTGTQFGDPLEVSAVARVFSGHGIFIGSVSYSVL
jgi:acyl transferase domain-containing protein